MLPIAIRCMPRQKRIYHGRHDSAPGRSFSGKSSGEKNAVLRVPGTAFFSLFLRTSCTRYKAPSHHQTQELFFLKRALMVWFAVTLLNA
jgi:hypothetical protein